MYLYDSMSIIPLPVNYNVGIALIILFGLFIILDAGGMCSREGSEVIFGPLETPKRSSKLTEPPPIDRKKRGPTVYYNTRSRSRMQPLDS
jgi:hypothetical protein